MNESSNCFIALIPFLPLVGFGLNSILALFAARRRKPLPYALPAFIGSILPICSFVLAVKAFLMLKGAHGEASLDLTLFPWLTTKLVSIPFGFTIDALSSVMLLIVTGVGSLIHLYSVGYMKEDPAFSRYFSYLNLFLFFMLVLLLGENLLVLFVGWEGVGLCSYLLIGFWFEDIDKAKAGMKAFVVNRIGDFGFLAGLFLILWVFHQPGAEVGANILSFSFLNAHKAALFPLATLITLCLFVGATGKSAQIPLYVWLPDAMAGPTPVSALIHAATMVTAGIYMVARMYFLFEMAPFTLHVIMSVGLATALLAALMAIAQYDIKKVLAYSTVSQLGFMFLALGVGSPQSALFHVMTHAFFKACLFLCSGSIIYALHHEQDIRHMGGLAKKLPLTCFAFLVSNLAIAGVPPFSGFFSKDEILLQTYLNAPRLVYVLAFLTAGLTAFYMFRLFTYVFLGEFRGGHGSHGHGAHDADHHGGVTPVPFIMNAPVFILALLAIVGGWVGVPEVLHGANHIHHWLENLSTPRAEEVSHSLELGLMGLSTAWGLGMAALATFLYSRNLNWAKTLQKKLPGTYALISNKFYVDELYDAWVVTPLKGISEFVLWKGADEKIVDNFLILGWSRISLWGARSVSWLQSGLLGHYLFYLWVGLAGVLFIILK